MVDGNGDGNGDGNVAECKTSTAGSNPALASIFSNTNFGGDKRSWPASAKFDHHSDHHSGERDTVSYLVGVTLYPKADDLIPWLEANHSAIRTSDAPPRFVMLTDEVTGAAARRAVDSALQEARLMVRAPGGRWGSESGPVAIKVWGPDEELEQEYSVEWAASWISPDYWNDEERERLVSGLADWSPSIDHGTVAFRVRGGPPDDAEERAARLLRTTLDHLGLHLGEIIEVYVRVPDDDDDDDTPA